MQATVKWQEGLCFESTTENGHKIIMDGSKEKGASPMEMVMMCAGNCASIDIVMILEKARQTITGVEVKLEGERVDAVPAVFSKIHMHFIVTGQDLSEKQVERAVNLSMEKYCSVSIMLKEAVTITHSFETLQA